MKFLNSSIRVGKYELGKTLGQGQYSKVKIAKNLENDTIVAIKILNKEIIHKYKMMENIKKEISSMKLLNHPYVVKLFDVMASETKIYLVQEYVSGGELLNKIKIQKPLKEDEARKYFQQLIDGVDYLHNQEIYHRDLKPNNILIDGDGNVKIADFDVSATCQQFGSDGLLHTTCGTPSYIAPETMNGKGYDGASTDLWSCGVVLFMLLAGYLPFEAPNNIALYTKILQGDFTCPLWFSPDAKMLVTRILDPNPKTRITIAHIRKDEWFSKGYISPKFDKDTKWSNNLKNFDAIFGDANERNLRPKSKDLFEINSLCHGLDESGLFKTDSTKKPSAEKETICSKKKPTKATLISLNSKSLSHWVSI